MVTPAIRACGSAMIAFAQCSPIGAGQANAGIGLRGRLLLVVDRSRLLADEYMLHFKRRSNGATLLCVRNMILPPGPGFRRPKCCRVMEPPGWFGG